VIFAVDFDGTVVEHKYPEIGLEIEGAVQTLSDLQRRGHKIIIWTCRAGEDLCKAKCWLARRGFFADKYNENMKLEWTPESPKIYADVYLDDRNFPPFKGWDEVRRVFLEGGRQ